MNMPFLVGEHVYLRPLTQADATVRYASWLNDEATNRFLETGHFPSTPSAVAAYIQRLEVSSQALFLAIVLKDGDRHIGNIKLEPINWIHRTAILGILIGEADARGKGYGTEAVVLVLRHAFARMNLHRVGLGVTADNEPAIRSYRKAGLKEEGRWREAIFHNGVYVDHVWMGILADEFFARHGR